MQVGLSYFREMLGLLTEPKCGTGCLSITIRELSIAGVAMAVSAIEKGKSQGKVTGQVYQAAILKSKTSDLTHLFEIWCECIYVPERLPAFQQVSLSKQHTTFSQLYKLTLWSQTYSIVEALSCGVDHSIPALLNLLTLLRTSEQSS